MAAICDLSGDPGSARRIPSCLPTHNERRARFGTPALSSSGPHSKGGQPPPAPELLRLRETRTRTGNSGDQNADGSGAQSVGIFGAFCVWRSGDESLPRVFRPPADDSFQLSASRGHDEPHDLAPDRHVHVRVIVQRNLARESEACFRPQPLSQVFTGGREFLYAAVAGVHDEDIAFTVSAKYRLPLPSSAMRGIPKLTPLVLTVRITCQRL